MLQCLDAASYAAKSSRRGGLLFFSAGMRDRLAGRMDIEQALKGALANDEIVLHYQPVVDATTGRVRSAEALMRWQRPGVGLVPGGFIDIAEQSGLIGGLGDWAIGEVCRQMKAWQAAGLALDTLNVNVSSVQLASDGFEDIVRDALLRTGLDPHCLTLEVTETSMIGEFEQSVERIRRLRALGVRIMIDDFGTGYASLKYLKLLPVDGLKIDRLFVKDLPGSAADEAIVTAVVGLAGARRDSSWLPRVSKRLDSWRCSVRRVSRSFRGSCLRRGLQMRSKASYTNALPHPTASRRQSDDGVTRYRW